MRGKYCRRTRIETNIDPTETEVSERIMRNDPRNFRKKKTLSRPGYGEKKSRFERSLS